MDKLERSGLKVLVEEALRTSPKCQGQVIGNNPLYTLYDGKIVYIYIKNLTPAQLSNNNPDIWRAQLSSRKDFLEVLNSDYSFIFLGYDAENDVYATWNPYWVKQRLNNATNVSFYSRLSIQKEAKEKQKVVCQELNNNGRVVVFPRLQLPTYLDNISRWFEKDTQYVALGSRLRSDANAAYRCLTDTKNLEKFHQYLIDMGYSATTVNHYEGGMRKIFNGNYIANNKILFMAKDNFEGYKEVIKDFFDTPGLKVLDEVGHKMYSCSFRTYIDFLIDQREISESSFDDDIDTAAVPVDTESSSSEPIFDENADYEFRYTKDGKLTKITNPKLIEQLRPFLNTEYQELVAAYSVVDDFYGERFSSMQLAEWNALFKKINWDNPLDDNPEKVGEKQKTEILRVTFPDGKVIQHLKVVDTFVEVIKTLDMQTVHDLGIIVAKDNLVSKKRNPKYIVAQKEMGDGWYLLTNSNTLRKREILQNISSCLKLGWVIDVVDFKSGAVLDVKDRDLSKKQIEPKEQLHPLLSSLRAIPMPQSDSATELDAINVFLSVLWKDHHSFAQKLHSLGYLVARDEKNIGWRDRCIMPFLYDLFERVGDDLIVWEAVAPTSAMLFRSDTIHTDKDVTIERITKDQTKWYRFSYKKNIKVLGVKKEVVSSYDEVRFARRKKSPVKWGADHIRRALFEYIKNDLEKQEKEKQESPFELSVQETVQGKLEDIIFTKVIDKSLLSAGVTIPHDKVALLKSLFPAIGAPGTKQKISIQLNDRVFDGLLTNVKFDAVKYANHPEVLQIRYTVSNPLVQYLKQIFPNSARALSDGARISTIPEEERDYIDICKTDNPNTLRFVPKI